MSAFQNEPTWLQSGVNGQMPALWAGVDLPDGDRPPWVSVPIGSIYAYKPSETAAVRHYEKRAVEDRDDDWGILGGVHVIQQRVELADFTDGGSAVGTLALTETIPIGAWVIQTLLFDNDVWTGATTLTIIVGDGTDTDRYSTGTPDIQAAAEAVDLGVPSGTKIHTAAKTVTITLTEDSEWGDLSAGGFTIRIYYYL